MTERKSVFDALPLVGEYRTIVADPPWDQGSSYAVTRGFAVRIPEKRTVSLPYPSMTLADIKALPVADLAAENGAHLYLWTTQQYLRDSFDVAAAWGFSVSATLTWCKKPLAIQLGGAFGATTEFVHFCRRGNLATTGTVDRRWFEWPRRRGAPVKMGQKRNEFHSAKPEAFLDLVESVSPGPYLELFSRRARLGWDVWGNESLTGGEAVTKSEAAA